jgi:MSHA biogenesis protein MshL
MSIAIYPLLSLCGLLSACTGIPEAIKPNLAPIEAVIASNTAKALLGYEFWATPQGEAGPAETTFNFRVNGVPAAHVVEIISKSEKLGFESDDCGRNPVSIHGVNMPMNQVLQSIQRQSASTIHREIGHLRLSCEEDTFREYRLDYLDLERKLNDLSSLSSVLERRNSGNGSGNNSGGGLGGSNQQDLGNQSRLTLSTSQNHDLWNRLALHIEFLISESEDIYKVRRQERTNDETEERDSQSRARNQGAKGSSRASQRSEREVTVREEIKLSGRVVVHPESGTVTVRAKPSQHHRVESWLQSVQTRIKRQVLVEAIIAEVNLDQRFERGIDWNLLKLQGLQAGLSIRGTPSSSPALTVAAERSDQKGELSAVLRLLETFGETKVVSSPRMLTMNQQAAVLKVIDNKVYFTTEVQTSAPTNNNPAFSTFNTLVQTVPVGFLMTVSAQVSDDKNIQLRVRPTLSRIVGFVQDPNPALKQLNIDNKIPEIQTREMESLLRLKSGEMVLLGGLKQQSQEKNTQGLPGMGPDYSWLAGSEGKAGRSTELVILLKASIQGEDHSNEATQEISLTNPLAKPLLTALNWARGGQSKAAENLLQELQKQHPTTPELPFNLGLIYANQISNREMAKSEFAKVEQLCKPQNCRLPLLEAKAWLDAQP